MLHNVLNDPQKPDSHAFSPRPSVLLPHRKSALTQTEWSKIWSKMTAATHQIKAYGKTYHSLFSDDSFVDILSRVKRWHKHPRPPYLGLPSLLQQCFSSQGSLNGHIASFTASSVVLAAYHVREFRGCIRRGRKNIYTNKTSAQYEVKCVIQWAYIIY